MRHRCAALPPACATQPNLPSLERDNRVAHLHVCEDARQLSAHPQVGNLEQALQGQAHRMGTLSKQGRRATWGR